ncbi:DUF4873 domain-containing protein [Williamsia sterculiae]|uniref:DUF4873 domain-containing protein n=1 Tax=Williamsia sterculiae TaxID=1344003 RepID=A0A1N7H9K7_9NOCA|nr:DUF4873 domain-containing protein [Williamsia sterculiae]SIS21348.1 protein of unknown function [Williamsia sterculiae]
MISRIARSRLSPTILDVDAGDAVLDAADDCWTLDDGRRAHLLIRMRRGADDSYLGVVDHRRPNEFTLGLEGADMRLVADHLAAAVEAFTVSGASRITLRAPVQRAWCRRRNRDSRRTIRRLRAFDENLYVLNGPENPDDEVIDRELTIRCGDQSAAARVRLAAHLDPLDGKQHWVGTAYGEQVRAWKDGRATEVLIGDDPHRVAARLAEVTPWGHVRVVGVGPLPFPTSDDDESSDVAVVS